MKINILLTRLTSLNKAFIHSFIHTLYEQAMTARSVDPVKNYEIFEQLGDLTINKFIVNYTYARFSVVDVKTVARVRINYASKNFLARLAEEYGFKNFIRATQLETHPTDLLEDTFEAFFGCTERILDDKYGTGVGYAVCYVILKNIFDKIDIGLNYEDLYDSKTQLKQAFDARPKTVKYTDTRNDKIFESVVTIDGIFFGRGQARKKIDAQQLAAQEALEKIGPITMLR